MGNTAAFPNFSDRLGAALGMPGKWLGFLALVAAILLTRLHSYLLFHSLAEIFSIVVAFGVFILAWNSDALVKNGYLLILGVGSVFVAFLDLMHTLAFQGMGVFPGNDANLPTQLWVAGRYLEALTLLLAPFLLHRTMHKRLALLSYGVLTALLLLAIFVWRVFPAAYVDGLGLTTFKVMSEYLIIAALAVAMLLLWLRRSEFDATVMPWLLGSIAAGIAADFSFTLYIGVTDLANLAGHVFKIAEFYFLYQALVETGFTRPYRLLLRHLKERDETQLEQEKGRAHARAAELDAIFSSMADGAALYAPDGSILRMNEAAARLFKVSSASPEQPASQRARLHSFIDEDGHPVDRLEDMPLGKVLRGETVKEMVLGLPRALTGDVIWLAFSAVPVFDAAGQLSSAVLTFRDMTERKQAEEDVFRLNYELERRVLDRTVQLEAANADLEAFASSVSHDLRAPLRHIDGFVELLQKQAANTLDERGRHYLRMIAGAAREMAKLMDGLLLFSRLGHAEMRQNRIELGPLVQDVICELEPQIDGRLVHWDVAELPPVCGDAALLRIAITNLLSNALKFTRPRQAAEIQIGYSEQRPAETIFFVQDNGVGFDMQYGDKLFGVFQRLHPAEEFEGTGIGLANVRRIIGRHGGRTWAEGRVDHGATFFFSLPKAA